MTLKLALILSAAWTLLIIVGAVVAISYLATHPIRGISAEERASAVGGGMGIVAAIGYGAIWLPLAAKLGRQRREARLAKRKTKKRSRR
jgi:type II secretory pathway component PulM